MNRAWDRAMAAGRVRAVVPFSFGRVTLKTAGSRFLSRPFRATSA